MKKKENKSLRMNRLMLIATLLIAFAFITTSGYAKRDDYTRTMKEKYEVNSNALLVVKNKFGDVHCQNWNENVISIEVTITVEASSEDKANKVFNKIDVLMKGSKDKVEAITELDGSFNNVEFSIDYDIMMPSSINLDLINKFGEIYIDEVDGTAKIGLSYGDMEVTAFNSPDVTLDIKFSDAEVDFIKAGKVDVQYSDVEINGAEKLDLKTRFSDVEIGNMGELNLDSQYDDLGIEKCGPLDCEGRFSDIELGELNGDLFLDIQYGGFRADNITSSFVNGTVENSFADVSLDFSTEVSFKVDAEMKFGDLSYPRNNSRLTHEEKGYTTNLYNGTIGKDDTPDGLLTIRSKNAGVSISFND